MEIFSSRTSAPSKNFSGPYVSIQSRKRFSFFTAMLPTVRKCCAGLKYNPKVVGCSDPSSEIYHQGWFFPQYFPEHSSFLPVLLLRHPDPPDAIFSVPHLQIAGLLPMDVHYRFSWYHNHPVLSRTHFPCRISIAGIISIDILNTKVE